MSVQLFAFDLVDSFLPIQNQHFNYTWLRLIRQQALCVVPQGLGNSVSLELCDNNKDHQRWLVNTNKVLVCSFNERVFPSLFYFPNAYLSQTRHTPSNVICDDGFLFFFIIFLKELDKSQSRNVIYI